MSELAKSLRTSLETELSSIEDDMTTRLNKLRTKMSEARKNIIKDENETLRTLRTNRETIESESESLMQSLNKIKLRYWLVPLIVGVSLILGLTLGTYLLGSWITSQFQDLQTLRAETAEAKKKQEKYIAKTYDNGIGLKSEYKPKSYKAEDGTWIVEFLERGN